MVCDRMRAESNPLPYIVSVDYKHVQVAHHLRIKVIKKISRIQPNYYDICRFYCFLKCQMPLSRCQEQILLGPFCTVLTRYARQKTISAYISRKLDQKYTIMVQEKNNQKKLKRTHRKVVFFPRKMSKIISRNAVIFENIMHFTLVNCTHMTQHYSKLLIIIETVDSWFKFPRTKLTMNNIEYKCKNH